jgi:hypothetical protein
MTDYDREIRKVLADIKTRNAAKIEPFFKTSIGFLYPGIDHHSLDEQIQFFDLCKKRGVVDGKPCQSILKCRSCNSYIFYTVFTCTMCRSPNFIRGTAIQHDFCGNIDFDYKYNKSNDILKCEKCNKELKGIGIDYSKIGYFYKCLKCGAMLPGTDQQYVCTQCGGHFTAEELQILQLEEYTVNFQRLDELLNANLYLDSVTEDLSRVGIKSEISGSIIGLSKMQHSFDLISFDEENHPIALIDIINLDNEEDAMTILSFIAKCADFVSIPNKILVAIPNLRQSLKDLVTNNKIILIESRTEDEAAVDLLQIIPEIHNSSDRPDNS